MMLVTAVIPTYNYGCFLGQAIDSVLCQGVELELIILDNASTDNTPEVVAPYLSDSRVKYVCHPENIGAIKNHQIAYHAGTGKYIKVLSADDFILPRYLKTLTAALERHPECCLAYTPCFWIKDDKTLGILRHPGHRKSSYFGGRNEVADLLIYDSYITPSAALIRRTALDAVGNSDENMGSAGDWDYWIKIALHNPNFIFVYDALTVYRLHEGQDSARFYASSEPLEGHIKVLAKVLQSPARELLRGSEDLIYLHLIARYNAYPDRIKYAQAVVEIAEELNRLKRLH